MSLEKIKGESGLRTFVSLAPPFFSLFLSQHTIIHHQTLNLLAHNVILQSKKKNEVENNVNISGSISFLYYFSKNQAALESSLIRSEPGRT